MTTSSTTIRPRLRTRTPEVEAVPEPAIVPDRLLLPRVLIRVPQLAFGQQIAVAVEPASPNAPSTASFNASVSINSTPEELAAVAEKDSIFNTLWSQATTYVPAKYLKLMGIGLLVIGGIWALRARGRHAAHDTPGTDAPAWAGPIAAPWPNQPGSGNIHGSGEVIQPSAGQFTGGPASTSQRPATLVPTGPFANGGWPSADAGPAGSVASQNRDDGIPPMPARDPAWGNTPSHDNSPIAQSGPPADGYRTAQRFDPTAVPAGHGDPSQPGVARFQGGISAPPGDSRQ